MIRITFPIVRRGARRRSTGSRRTTAYCSLWLHLLRIHTHSSLIVGFESWWWQMTVVFRRGMSAHWALVRTRPADTASAVRDRHQSLPLHYLDWRDHHLESPVDHPPYIIIIHHLYRGYRITSKVSKAVVNLLELPYQGSRWTLIPLYFHMDQSEPENHSVALHLLGL